VELTEFDGRIEPDDEETRELVPNGMAFQGAPLDSMTVAENVAFPKDALQTTQGKIKERVDFVLNRVAF
jgi:ABC-type transporter Mla maintaining outer membrane lipid asymmetry ATPase subunit MlaF